jgi:signal peptidase II
MKNIFLRLFLLVSICLMNIGCDQVTKHYFKNRVSPGSTIHVVKDFFIITYAENQGGFLSLGAGLPSPLKLVLLVWMPVVLIILAFIYLFSNYVLRPSLGLVSFVSLASVIAGGASNLADRFAHGAVFDFMVFGVSSLRTGVVNAADLSITFGAIIFALSLRNRKTEKT